MDQDPSRGERGATILIGSISRRTIVRSLAAGLTVTVDPVAARAQTATPGTASAARPGPNLYDLAGDGVRITYSTSGIDGRAHFGYQGPEGTLSYPSPDLGDIRTVESDVGTLVSVTLRKIVVDVGAVHLTLVLPLVAGTTSAAAPDLRVTTLAIRATDPNVASPPPAQRSYEVLHLTGSARSVDF